MSVIYFKILECVNSYRENCFYPCSENCINRTCDIFNGSCMCNSKDEVKYDQGILFNEISSLQLS